MDTTQLAIDILLSDNSSIKCTQTKKKKGLFDPFFFRTNSHTPRT